jgi:hypothetical protein
MKNSSTSFAIGRGETQAIALSRFQHKRIVDERDRSTVGLPWWQDFDAEEVSIDVGLDIMSDEIVVDQGRKIVTDRGLWIHPAQMERVSVGDNAFRIDDPDDDPLMFEDGLSLSAEQSRAVADIIETDKMIIRLTGKAGTGKSAILKWFKRKTNAVILATTGRAALNIGGSTVDSFFCFKRPDDGRNDNKRFLEDNELAAFRDCWIIYAQSAAKKMYSCGQFIFIDEASMVGTGMMAVIYALCRIYKKKLILVGDWAQAAPVKDGWITGCPQFMRNNMVIYLQECHRQTDRTYLNALDAVRRGFSHGQSDLDLFEEVFRPRVGPPPTHDLGIRLMAYKDKVREYNGTRLDELLRRTNGKILAIRPAFFDFRTDKQKVTRAVTDNAKFAMWRDAMMAWDAGDGAQLAIGAHVVITKNDPNVDPETGERAFTNGQTGKLIGVLFGPSQQQIEAAKQKTMEEVSRGEFDYAVAPTQPQPQVDSEPETDSKVINARIARGDNVIRLIIEEDETNNIIGVTSVSVGEERSRWVRGSIGLKSKYYFCSVGFPVVLGYALTIHKAQGLSVNYAYVDMADIEKFGFKHGLAYVALSRTRTLEGLVISRYIPQAVQIDREMRDFI